MLLDGGCWWSCCRCSNLSLFEVMNEGDDEDDEEEVEEEEERLE